MTALIGILCKDGVVVGADSSVTFSDGQMRIIEQKAEKLVIVGDKVIVAGTGGVGFGQRFCAVVNKCWNAGAFKGSEIEIGKQLSREAIQDFASTFAKTGQYGALVAFPSEHRPYLCEFEVKDFQPEFKTDRLWYCSMGSSQPITDPFLALIREVFWEDGPPTIQEAVFAATWALEHAIAVNPGGVNGPPRIAVLENAGKGHFSARVLSDAELDEHRQYIAEAKKTLKDFKKGTQQMQGSAPSLPAPPSKKS